MSNGYYNLEAEQALLGAALIQNDVIYDVENFLHTEHFFDPLHQRIYSHIKRLVSAGASASVVRLKSEMTNDKGLITSGGDEYLANLYSNATTLSNAHLYGKLIRDLAVKRGIRKYANDLIENLDSKDEIEHPKDLLEKAERGLSALSDLTESGSQDLVGMEPIVDRALEVAAAAHDGKSPPGIPTGFMKIDNIIGAMGDSHLITLAARPAMGKTALAANIAMNVAKSGKRVAFFSLEMSATELATRFISSEYNVPYHDLRTGKVPDQEYEDMRASASDLRGLGILIDKTGGISIQSLCARARRAHRRQPLGLVVVDYLQLITSSKRASSYNRVAEVTEISGALKGLAKELDVPVLALSQLSRAVEQRNNKRPILSDLRESGAIEQDSDVVAFLFREEYYLQQNEPDPTDPDYAKWQVLLAEQLGQADFIVSKNRHGAVGTARMKFDGKTVKFSDN